jgi:hypothetical protein
MRLQIGAVPTGVKKSRKRMPELQHPAYRFSEAVKIHDL